MASDNNSPSWWFSEKEEQPKFLYILFLLILTIDAFLRCAVLYPTLHGLITNPPPASYVSKAAVGAVLFAVLPIWTLYAIIKRHETFWALIFALAKFLGSAQLLAQAY
jgi:hypothetical protein